MRWWACVLARHQERCGYRVVKRSASPPQRNVAVAHCVLQGKGLVRQRSLSADLIFVSFYQEKEKRPPRP